MTPLHLAALGGQVEAIKFLMEQGADIHKTAKVSCYFSHLIDYYSYVSMYVLS